MLGQTTTFFTTAKALLTSTLIPLVFALALLTFFWGVVKYIWSAGTEKEEGRKIMIWGVVALFVMTSIWGLVRFLGDQFGIVETSSMPIPRFTGTGGQ